MAYRRACKAGGNRRGNRVKQRAIQGAAVIATRERNHPHPGVQLARCAIGRRLLCRRLAMTAGAGRRGTPHAPTPDLTWINANPPTFLYGSCALAFDGRNGRVRQRVVLRTPHAATTGRRYGYSGYGYPGPRYRSFDLARSARTQSHAGGNPGAPRPRRQWQLSAGLDLWRNRWDDHHLCDRCRCGRRRAAWRRRAGPGACQPHRRRLCHGSRQLQRHQGRGR